MVSLFYVQPAAVPREEWDSEAPSSLQGLMKSERVARVSPRLGSRIPSLTRNNIPLATEKLET